MKAADPRATLELEYTTLYDHDSGGRLAPVDRHGNPAPDLTIGRIDGAVMSRLRNDLSDDLAAELTALAADEPVTASLEDSPRFDREYRQLLGMGHAVAEVYVALVLSSTPVSPGLKRGVVGCCNAGPGGVQRVPGTGDRPGDRATGFCCPSRR
ncbi:MAG TPA: hypothetical protein QGH28_09465 [Chloroflexota bacterium]|nr:hypothetical protein [Chloroflexota bacterium]